MKKILFASTALVAAGMMSAGAASASEKIKLELGGYSKWWVVGAWQDSSFQAAQLSAAGNTNVAAGDFASVDVKGDNEIFFGGSTKLDNGMVVGVNVELEAGGNVETTNNAANNVIDKSYVFIETAYGKFIVGSEANGTALLHVLSPDAAGNIDADGILTGGFAIQNPGITAQVSTSIDTDTESEKITYVAPTFYGLTLGASYIPSAISEDNRGVVIANEAYGIGALYANTFGPVGFKLSGGWVTYDTTAFGNSNENSTEISTGTQLTYGNWTLGASYRAINDSFSVDNNNTSLTAFNALSARDGYVWDAGLMYGQGPWAVSFYTFKSVADGSLNTVTGNGEDEFTVYQVSAKYTLGAGVDALASVGHAEYDDETQKVANNDGNHNKGWAVMTGLGLAF